MALRYEATTKRFIGTAIDVRRCWGWAFWDRYTRKLHQRVEETRRSLTGQVPSTSRQNDPVPSY